MGQYQTGTITLVQGSEKVSGESCAWITNGIQVGHTFKKRGEDAIYNIGLVNSEMTLSLTAPYSGTSCSGEQYEICKNFTTNYSFPEIWAGDKDWAYHLTTALRAIDTAISNVSGEATQDIVDQGNIVTLSLSSSDYNKIHLVKNTGEANINLPPYNVNDIGKYLDFRKRGSGELTIWRSGEATIHGQNYINNSTEQTFAAVVLTLEEENYFGMRSTIGDWDLGL